MVLCPYINDTTQITDFQNVVTVLVGVHEKKYVLHKSILTASSTFFATALKPSIWKEGHEGIVRMPEDNPETFTLFAEWLYTGKFETGFVVAIAAEEYQSPCQSRERLEVEMLARAYVLGDKVQVPMFKAQVIDLLACRLRKTVQLPTPDLISFVYENTISGSPLRRLVCNIYVHEAPPDNPLYEQIHELGFFRDLAKFSRKALIKSQSQDKAKPLSTCRYHDHDSG